MWPKQDAALIFSENVRRIFGENNLNSTKKCDGNLQPESLKTKESRKNGKRSSIPKKERDGVSTSAARGSKELPGEGPDTNNDFPSTKKQQCNVMLGNGMFQVNSTEQNQSTGTGLNASGSNAQISKREEDEIRRERKRQSNRESAKRSRIRKQQECEELHRNVDILKDENSKLIQSLKRHSEDSLELSNENDSIEEELVKMYGPESIADLMSMKPASSGSQKTVKEESYN